MLIISFFTPGAHFISHTVYESYRYLKQEKLIYWNKARDIGKHRTVYQKENSNYQFN